MPIVFQDRVPDVDHVRARARDALRVQEAGQPLLKLVWIALVGGTKTDGLPFGPDGEYRPVLVEHDELAGLDVVRFELPARIGRIAEHGAPVVAIEDEQRGASHG